MLALLKEPAQRGAWLRGHSIGGIVGTIVSLLFSVYMLYLFAYGKCDMTFLLQPLLARAARHLNAVPDVKGCWLDCGTLLGAVRDGAIIPWEFDVDLGVELADCPKFQALKPQMEADGMHVFFTGDWVPGKENKLLGYDGFLHKPCARFYSEDYRVFIDFDWNKRFTYAAAQEERERVVSQGGVFDIPAGYTEDQGDILCNFEAWDPSVQGEGGCRLARSIFPLQPINMLGIPLQSVADPDQLLTDMYGPDWRTPRPKGYKLLFCSWMPVDTLKFAMLWLCIAVGPFVAWRMLPRVWRRLRGGAATNGKPLIKYVLVGGQSDASHSP